MGVDFQMGASVNQNSLYMSMPEKGISISVLFNREVLLHTSVAAVYLASAK